MEYSTIGYAPLEGSGKPVPEKSTIPEQILLPLPEPPFMETYGPWIYLAIVAVFGIFVILPIIEYWWDIENSEDEMDVDHSKFASKKDKAAAKAAR